MTNNRIVILLIALIGIVMVARAEEPAPAVIVKKSANAYSIYAKGYGRGTTLEFAKFAAINDILPQLVNQTNDMPGSIQSIYGVNGNFSGQGSDQLQGKTFIKGYWKLEDGVYIYTIELLIKNDNVENENE